MKKLLFELVKPKLLKMSVFKTKTSFMILLFSFIYGNDYNSFVTLDKDGNEYDLSQKMSINMQDSDIKNVLMLIGELAGLNIVVTPEVKDTITANLQNVSVKAALDVILVTNGYDYVTQENIIIVKEKKINYERDVVTKVVKLKYIDTAALQRPLQNIFTSQGQIDPFTPVVSLAEEGQGYLTLLSLPMLKKIFQELCQF